MLHWKMLFKVWFRFLRTSRRSSSGRALGDNPQKVTFQKSGIINQTLATEKSDSILSFLDETKSGIWNRVNFIRKVSKSEDLKISISSLATTKMHLEQFLVFEIHSYLSPG